MSSLQLPDLDPDDPRAVSQQIANGLRSAILLGHLSPGEQLPSQNDLAARYGVARETVKAALRILDREQLIISRQGSGSFVRSRRSTTPKVADFLSGAYTRPHVWIDYAGWRGETLSKALPDTLEALRGAAGIVRTIRIRLLLTDPRVTTGFPQPVDPDVDPAAVQPALAKLTDRAISTIRETSDHIIAAGLAERADVHVRVHSLGPIVKIYTVNEERSLVGLYPVTEHVMEIDGRDTRLHHPSGWDATVVDIEEQTQTPSFADQSRSWFASIWNTIATDYQPR